MLSQIGSLWFWRGNYYDIVGLTDNGVKLRECGTDNYFIQEWVGDTLNEPVTPRQHRLGRIAQHYGSLTALSPAERQELPPGTHFCREHGKALIFGRSACAC